MRPICSPSLLLAALVLLCAPVRAGIQILMVPTPPACDVIDLASGPQTFDFPVPFPRFDPALGVLDSAEIVVAITQPHGLWQAENTTSTPIVGMRYMGNAFFFWGYRPSSTRIPRWPVQGSGLSLTYFGSCNSPWLPPGSGMAPFDGVVNYQGVSASYDGIPACGDVSPHALVTDHAQLARFTGSGALTLYWHPSGGEEWQNAPAGHWGQKRAYFHVEPINAGVIYRYH